VHDVIGVGTSPLMLMRAARLAEAGSRVVLIDRATRLGGGWAVGDVLGFSNVELGVHLLENRPELYRELSRVLDGGLAEDPCATLLKGRMLPMRAARAAFHAGVGLNSLRRLAPDRARRSFTSAWRAVLNARRDFLYPVGGAAQIIEAMAARLRRAGGEIRLGEEVVAASIEAVGVRCETSSGARAAERLLVSSRACPPLWVLGAKLSSEVEVSSVYSTILRFRTTEAMDRSYVEIVGDSTLKRVRDLVPLVRPRPDADERVWCVQRRAAGPADAWADGQEILNHLVRLGLAAQGSTLVAAHKSDVRLVTVTDRGLEKMSRAAEGKLEVLRTTDFADGFVTQATVFA
jgi:phytoene dehydrogenase-like protein